MRDKLKHEPAADLNAPRLEDVSVARNDAEVTVVQIQVRQAITPAVEKVEDLQADLEVSRFGDARLLHNAEVFGKERPRAQTTVCWRRIAEEPLRIRVVGRVFRTANRALALIGNRGAAKMPPGLDSGSRPRQPRFR